jgi:hypothetical protein
MKVPITAYIMFIVDVLSFVDCPSDCGVTVNQMYVLHYILNTTEKQEKKRKTRIKRNLKFRWTTKVKDQAYHSCSSPDSHYDILNKDFKQSNEHNTFKNISGALTIACRDLNITYFI